MNSAAKTAIAKQLPTARIPSTITPPERQKDMIEVVRQALRKKRVMLAFQPIVRAASPEKPAFYEALIRVLDESGRVIPAGAFMPQVEDKKLGRELDTLALHLGLKALHDNQQLRLSINMSARTIGYGPWMQTLEHWFAKDEFLAERLVLEITESSALSAPEQVAEFMKTLQLRGVCFAIDDFGAGQTALRYMKDFHFDMIKIDGQFVKGIATNLDNQVLVTAIVSIACHFDMLIVGECVENAADAEKLTQLGVDCLQGYHFAAANTRPDWLRGAHLQPAM